MVQVDLSTALKVKQKPGEARLLGFFSKRRRFGSGAGRLGRRPSGARLSSALPTLPTAGATPLRSPPTSLRPVSTDHVVPRRRGRVGTMAHRPPGTEQAGAGRGPLDRRIRADGDVVRGGAWRCAEVRGGAAAQPRAPAGRGEAVVERVGVRGAPGLVVVPYQGHVLQIFSTGNMGGRAGLGVHRGPALATEARRLPQVRFRSGWPPGKWAGLAAGGRSPCRGHVASSTHSSPRHGPNLIDFTVPVWKKNIGKKLY